MKQRTNRFLVAATTAMLFAAGASAGGNSTGNVTNTYVVDRSSSTPDTSTFIFRTAATIAGTPVCNIFGEYAVRLSTPAGKSIQQQVQLAIALGKAVAVTGDGTCPAPESREAVLYIAIVW